jgi:hypothetical protein
LIGNSNCSKLYLQLHYGSLIAGNRIGGVMVSVLVSSAVDRGFEPRSGQTKDYKIGICCFSAKHAALRRKSKDWLAWNTDNVSECSCHDITEKLLNWRYTNNHSPYSIAGQYKTSLAWHFINHRGLCLIGISASRFLIGGGEVIMF